MTTLVTDVMPVLLRGHKSGFDLCALGVDVSEVAEATTNCLVNETPGSARPSITLYRLAGDNYSRHVCLYSGGNTETGKPIFHIDDPRYEALYGPTPTDPGMILFSPHRGDTIEPLELKLFTTLNFSGSKMIADPLTKSQDVDHLKQLLDAADRLVRTDKIADLETLDRLLQSMLTGATGASCIRCYVPDWCLILMRRLIGRCDDLQDGLRLKPGKELDIFCWRLDRLQRHMRSYLPA